MSCPIFCFFVTIAFHLIFRGADLLLAQGRLICPLDKTGDGVISPSTSDRSVVPTSADAAARPVAPATSSGLSWRGFKAPKKLVVKREKM